MKKFVLGMILSLSMLGAADADAVPKYNASCMFNGCGGVSDEGERAIFTFDDMYPGPDADFDIYQRVNGETSKLIDYPEGKYRQAQLEFVSDNARRAIVETRSPLTPDDTDGWGNDFFAVQDGVPELISWDPADPSTKSENIDLQLIDATDDGRTLYFYRFPPVFRRAYRCGSGPKTHSRRSRPRIAGTTGYLVCPRTAGAPSWEASNPPGVSRTGKPPP